jgi:hypothetical protein
VPVAKDEYGYAGSECTLKSARFYGNLAGLSFRLVFPAIALLMPLFSQNRLLRPSFALDFDVINQICPSRLRRSSAPAGLRERRFRHRALQVLASRRNAWNSWPQTTHQHRVGTGFLW